MNYKFLLLPLSFAIIGYLVTTKYFLTFLNGLDPVRGLTVYYLIVSCAIILLEYIGLIIADVHFNSFYHFLGTLLLNFSFFTIVIWSNCYVAEITKGICTTAPGNISNIYLNTESGASYYLWSKITDDIRTRRILTFIITPFVLSILGLILIRLDS
jgi:hypothetical protein